MSLHSLRSLPKDLKTDPAALPLEMEGGEEAVLVIHGYTGIPDELRYFARRLYEAGYTVAVPRLPGHGTHGADFLSSNAQDWYRKVVDTYSNLAAKHSTIHWAGLSMGALLAILGASQFSARKIVLAAPALEVFDHRLYLTPFLRYLVKRIERKDFSFDGPPEYAHVAETYWKYDWPAQAAELLKLQRLSQKELVRLTADMMVIVSEKDDTVPLTVLERIQKQASTCNVTSLVLKESGHVVLNDVEKERVAEEVIVWLKTPTP